jgi:RNA polymerase sigma-70 factor (ECF subfamily)
MNKRAFEKFYKANIDRIYRYVFFRVGQNEEITQDLVSEIFIKALKAFDRYDEKVSKSSWIYTIAHNHLANYYRDRKVASDIDDIAFCLEGENGKEEMEKKESTYLLRQALDELEEEERRLVTMKYLEGYSYKEMARRLERSSDALKVATFRAMKKLKTQLKDHKTESLKIYAKS